MAIADARAVDQKQGSTLPLIPGHPPGFCVQRSLFYNSTSWLDVLHADIEKLLTAFTKAAASGARGDTNSKGGTMGKGNGKGKGKGKGKGNESVDNNDGSVTAAAGAPQCDKITRLEGESPFELFKRIWIAHGWSKVHLLGVPTGPMRKPWGESVVRAFLEHLHEGEDQLKQVAAVFALYTFYSTQARSQERIHIAVAPHALDYICQLPMTLAAALSPSPSSPPTDAATTITETSDATASTTLAAQPLDTVIDPALSANATSSSTASTSNAAAAAASSTSPSLDLTAVIASLISSSAFFLVPSELYFYPPASQRVAIRDATMPEKKLNAKLILGAEEEDEDLRRGKRARIVVDDHEEELMGLLEGEGLEGEGEGEEDDEEDEGDEEDYGLEEEEGEGADPLARWTVPVRAQRGEYYATKSSRFPRRNRTDDLTITTTGGETSGESRFRSSMLRRAENLTLTALKDASAKAEPVVPKIREKLDNGDVDAKGLGLFRLVGKREKEGEKGLKEFDGIMQGLREEGRKRRRRLSLEEPSLSREHMSSSSPA